MQTLEKVFVDHDGGVVEPIIQNRKLRSGNPSELSIKATQIVVLEPVAGTAPYKIMDPTSQSGIILA